jgi:glucose-1-phosphate adenylyltransferase
MDYGAMLRFHIEKNAVATIAVLPVPMEEAHRFGIMNTDEADRVTSFEEKPKQPKSNKASMGIYIFNWKALKECMRIDDENPNSTNDFGNDIIPAIINGGQPVYAYPFKGYWKDVGTIQSLWEANMDIIATPPKLVLNDPQWRIYSRNPIMPPHYVGANASITQSLVTEGCRVEGKVHHSVLFSNVSIEAGAEVYDSVIFPGAVIRRGAKVYKAIVGENATVGEDAIIGGELRLGDQVDNSLTGTITMVGNDISIQSGAYLPQGTVATEDACGGRSYDK